VKNGDATIKKGAEGVQQPHLLFSEGQNKSQGHKCAREIAGIMIFLRSNGQSKHAAQRPNVMAGMARDSMMPMMTSPECVRDMASANTAILLKLSPDLAHHLPHPHVAVVAIPAKGVLEIRGISLSVFRGNPMCSAEGSIKNIKIAILHARKFDILRAVIHLVARRNVTGNHCRNLRKDSSLAPTELYADSFVVEYK